MNIITCTLVLSIGLCATTTRSLAAQFISPKANPDGSFQATLLTTPGESYTVEASTNLAHWEPKYCFTGVGNEITFVYPPALISSDCVYYRSTLGTAVVSRLSFRFSAYGGAWAQGWMASPIQMNGYDALFTRQNDSEYPSPEHVLFTGPSGCGLSNSPATTRIGSQYKTHSTGVLPGSGLWRITYRGTNFSYELRDPQTHSRLVIPFPSVAQKPGDVLHVSWAYRDAKTGLDLGSPPTFITQVIVSVGNYTSEVLPADATEYDFHGAAIPRDGANVTLTYSDTLGNEYSVWFSQLAP